MVSDLENKKQNSELFFVERNGSQDPTPPPVSMPALSRANCLVPVGLSCPSEKLGRLPKRSLMFLLALTSLNAVGGIEEWLRVWALALDH